MLFLLIDVNVRRLPDIHINARHPSAWLGEEECFRCFLAKTAVSGLEVEVLQGLDGLVGVAPAAGGVVEGLVGEEVLIGGVE